MFNSQASVVESQIKGLWGQRNNLWHCILIVASKAEPAGIIKYVSLTT